jgi:hypothetical protein
MAMFALPVLIFLLHLQKAVLEVLREEGVPAIPLQLDFMLASVKTKKD